MFHCNFSLRVIVDHVCRRCVAEPETFIHLSVKF